jgi:hypothetical protein
VSLGRDPRGEGGARGGPAKPQTFTARGWTGLNLTDSRLSIDDRELATLDNGMLLGGRVIPVPLYNGPAGVALSASLIKESFGASLTFTPNAVPHPVGLFVFEDGSAKQRDFSLDGAVDSVVAPVGTFATSPGGTGISLWQDGPILFLDAKSGYLSWNGTVLTTIDGGKLGRLLAVFEAHVWLVTAPRTITFTAPNSFSNFVAGDGAGSFKITDDAFVGAITQITSTVQQLWILGASAIDALGNVATAGGLTTFAVTNALGSLGTIFADSVLGYFRSLTFSTGYSIHSLLGVTPQKLSAKIDRLFAALGPAITFGPRAGIQQLNGRLVLVFLYQFTDPVTAAVRSMLLCFDEGRWFTCQTPDLAGNRVVDLLTLTIKGFPEVFGVDRAGFTYRIFARSTDTPAGTMTVRGKLYDLGAPTEGHEGKRIGLDLSAPPTTVIAPITLTLVSEQRTAPTSITFEKFLPVGDDLLGLRYALLRTAAPLTGERLGWTLQVPCASGVALEAVHLEHAPTGDWNVVDPAVAHLLWLNDQAVLVDWRNTPAGVLVGGWLG